MKLKCIIYVECLSNCKHTFNAFPYSYNIQNKPPDNELLLSYDLNINIPICVVVKIKTVHDTNWLDFANTVQYVCVT